MEQKVIKVLPASIRSRLQHLARDRKRPFQEIFFYYAMERFLYRLTLSPHASSFVLRGGLMFERWGLPNRRPTRDIDVQAYLTSSIENLTQIVEEICNQEVEPDGMVYDPASVHGEHITELSEYQGVRVRFKAYLGAAWLGLHMDVSFGNVITPSVILIKYPTLLDMPEFEMQGYPYETTISEKFQAMVFLETINDRMNDFYDIFLLSQHIEFRSAILTQAIKATFNTRNTEIPEADPIALTDRFAHSRQPDWKRFLERTRMQEIAPEFFIDVVHQLRSFLLPPTQALKDNIPFDQHWKPGGPWINYPIG